MKAIHFLPCPPRATLLTLISAMASLTAIPQAKAIEFEISSIPGSEIIFTGDGTSAAMTFSGGNNFQIDTVVDGMGSATGYVGAFSGVWTMGPVTTVTLVPLVETAPVSGSGSLLIDDGTDLLTATITWVQATSLKTPLSVATLGLTGNVTGLSYTGTDSDLLSFAYGLDQAGGVLAFTFPPPGQSLAELVQVGSQSTSFSGNLVETGSVVPESSGAGLLVGTMLLGMGVLQRRHRSGN